MVVHLVNLMRLFVLLVGQLYFVKALMCFQPHVIDCLSDRSCFFAPALSSNVSVKDGNFSDCLIIKLVNGFETFFEAS